MAVAPARAEVKLVTVADILQSVADCIGDCALDLPPECDICVQHCWAPMDLAYPSGVLGTLGSKEGEIMADARKYDEVGGAYPPEFVRLLPRFYSDGVGAEHQPVDPLVTRRLCREVVIGFLWEVLLEKVDSQPDRGDFQNPSTEQVPRGFVAC